MGERLPCTQEAIGSNPFTSTILNLEMHFELGWEGWQIISLFLFFDNLDVNAIVSFFNQMLSMFASIILWPSY